MSESNRKKEYNRIISMGKVPPDVLIKEFGEVPNAKEPENAFEGIKIEEPKKKKGKR